MNKNLKPGWSYKKLDELGFVGRGKSKHRPRNDPSLYGGKYPFIQTGEVKSADLYISKYSQTYNNKGLAQSKLWEPGTLLITIAANIADTAILKITACFPDSIVGFVADPDKADVHFIKYYIDTIKLHMQNISRGTTQDNLSIEKIQSFDFLIPPLPTQRKIAAILSAYDDLIENNTRRIEILEEMARSLYREWFVKFRFPGHEQVRMVDSELGPVPEGWEVKKLAALVETQYGYTESASKNKVGPKYVRGMDINKTSYIQWDSVPYCPINDTDYAKYRLKAGDVLVIRMADPGKVGIVENQIDAVFASYLIRLKITSSKLSPYLLFYFLLSECYQNYVTGACTGTTRKSASAGVLTDINLVIPIDDIRQKFEEQISVIRRMLNKLLEKNANLRKTRDLLLPRLISGEIDVENLDIKTGEIAA
ncbi:restriction endonuclease subunit S [Ancylothrix sp. C2]|uniref:restriction endonuclease subunit S n=1 Tax=Ancylothrix sp. D3o TaxID=2953691 RepID=UPI0021BBB4F3|nr:restriction endonuclease subunit S [Ancylothrix sp. D3o]MCT7950740.1 restriction endonuclease subunit S [Ancylothrix sp. D3o]